MKKKYIKTFESYVADLQSDALNEESLHEAKGPSKDLGLGAKNLKDLKIGDLVWKEMERHNPQLGVYYTLNKEEVAKVTGRKIWLADKYSYGADLDPKKYFDRDTGDEASNSRAAYGSAYYSILTHQQVLDAIKQNPDKYRKDTVKDVKSLNVNKAQEFLNEGNAFVYARQKAIDEDQDEFEFNGKTYPVTGNKKGGKSLKESETELNEAEKIACLECDEVNTKAAWKKNNGVCPSCNVSTQGVKESISENKVYSKEGTSPHKDLVTVGSDAPGLGIVKSYRKVGKDTYIVTYENGTTQKLSLQHGSWIEESENIDEAKVKEAKLLTLEKYKSKVKDLVDKETFEDQDFYDKMVDAFSQGITPEKFVAMNEGNAFVNAKRKAEEEGKDEFEFEGKTYKTK